MTKKPENLDTFKSILQVEIASCLKKLYPAKAKVLEEIKIDLMHPKEENHGDYSSTICLKISNLLGIKPIDIAQEVMSCLTSQPAQLRSWGVEKVEIEKPGFLNFWLTEEFFITQLYQVLDKKKNFWQKKITPAQLEINLKKLSKDIKLDQKKPQIKIMMEFCHPNTHKEFHIGHLRNIVLAESLIRLLENLQVKVIRVNYQGDVGMHIAKCLYGIQQIANWPDELAKLEQAEIEQKVAFLAQAYVRGNQAYEADKQAREAIVKINCQIYNQDPAILALWQKTRQWSLAYFAQIYQLVGSYYHRYYFESEVYQQGKKLVEDYLKKGVFVKSDRAVIFPGEKYGLHNRVFITSEGFPTYEAKDIGLAFLQFKEYQPDLIVHVVGPEQAGYFQVVFQALNQIDPLWQGRQLHFIYGWVQLKQGKMSSRKGNVVTAKWLFAKATQKARALITGRYSQKESEAIAQKTALAAVKYSLLKFAARSDLLFDFDESVSLEGDSGPYLLYTYARTKSVLRQAKKLNFQFQLDKNQPVSKSLNQEEKKLLKTIAWFSEAVYEAAVNFSPNLLCLFLFELSQKYNLFYTKHSILAPQEKEPLVREFRLHLTYATALILQEGLYLLGIPVLERM